MNNTITVNLNEVKKISEFVNDAVSFESDIDVIRNRYVLDATSLMGILSLDLSKPVDVMIHPINEKELIRFNEVFKKYE